MKKVVIIILTLLILHKPSLIRSENNPQTEEEIKVKIQLLKNGNDRYRYKPFTIYHSAQRYYEKDNPEAIAWEIIKTGKKAVQPLIEALKNENEDIRCWSAYLLGEIGDKSAVKPLLSVLNDSSECVVADSIMSLGKLNAKESKSILLKKVNDKSPHIRGNVLYYLGKIKDRTATDIIIKGLQDETCYVEWRAALALGQIKDNKAFEPLKKLLLEKSKTLPKECVMEVRDDDILLPYKWAMWSIGELGNKDGVGVLASIHPRVTEGLADDLYLAYLKIGSFYNSGKTLSSKEAQLLLDSMKNDIIKAIGTCEEIRFEYKCDSYNELFKRLLITKIVQYLGDRLIEDNMNSSNIQIKLKISEMLDYIHGKSKNDDQRLLMHKNPELRAIAIRNFYKSFDNNMLKYIYDSLKDQNRNLKISAMEAIQAYACPDDAEKVIPLFKDQDSYVRQIAIETVGRLNPTKYIDQFQNMLEDNYQSVREAAITALGNSHSPQVIPILENLLTSKIKYDHDHLMEVLASLGSKEAIILYQKYLKNLKKLNQWSSIIQNLKASNQYHPFDKEMIVKKCKEYSTSYFQNSSSDLDWAYLCDNIDILINFLKNYNTEDYLVKRTIEYFGSSMEENAITSLGAHLKSQSWEIRELAIRSLNKINNKKSIPYLIYALDDPSDTVKSIAINTLGSVDAKETEKRIGEFLAYPNGEVRCAAAGALINIGTENVLQQLKDSENSNCYYAKLAIEKITSRSQ